MFVQILTGYFLETVTVIHTYFKLVNSTGNNIGSSRPFEEFNDANSKCISMINFSHLGCLI